MDKFLLFPGPFLYISEVKNHSKIKKSIVPFIKNHSKKLEEINDPGEKVFSSFYDKHSVFPEFLNINGFLNDIVWNPLDNMIENMPFEMTRHFKTSKIPLIWYQYYKTAGGHHKEHVHGASTFSGIYVVHSTEPNRTVFFGAGAGNQIYQRYQHHTNYVTEGHVMIFPSEMFHKVLPNKHERIVIAFNIAATDHHYDSLVKTFS